MLANVSKKDLGAFYTPEILTDILCKWAIKDHKDTVLEPSFGGCGFLRSSQKILRERGCDSPNTQIYGCDIDSNAFNFLSTTFAAPIDLNRFAKSDFLELSLPQEWPEKFSSIVGNPPYKSYHHINIDIRDKVIEKLADHGCQMDKRASLWAYFVGLSATMNAQNGRMAWVLPSSFLHANYSQKLRLYLASAYRTTIAFEIKQRLFLEEGTDEQTIILLADGKKEYDDSIPSADKDIPLIRCDDLDGFVEQLDKWSSDKVSGKVTCATSVQGSMSKLGKTKFEELIERSECSLLGDFLNVRLGMVTGDNKYFILTAEKAKELGINKGQLPKVLAKFRFAEGLEYDNQDHHHSLKNGHPGILVSTSSYEKASKNIQSYLDSYPEEKIDKSATFRKRKNWYEPDDNRPPDAFFPVMHHLGPRLVLNTQNINCTNTIHRVRFHPKTSITTQRLLSISCLSTFSQVSAEIAGRTYGSGVLKHEPREAEKIALLLPSAVHHKTVESIFYKVSTTLRSGEVDSARRIVDQFILEGLGLEWEPLHIILNNELVAMRAHRHR